MSCSNCLRNRSYAEHESRVIQSYDGSDRKTCRSRGIQSRRGFVALLDSIAAIVVLITFSGIIATALQQKILDPQVQLTRQGMDVLTVLEYSSGFYSPSAVFDETSDSVCMRLEVYNGTSSDIDYTAVKSGCSSSSAVEKVIWRSFVNNGQFNSAKLAIWVKT